MTIFALQLAVGIYAYVQVNEDGDVTPLVERSLKSAFDEYNDSNEVREAFDVMQKEVSKTIAITTHITLTTVRIETVYISLFNNCQHLHT